MSRQNWKIACISMTAVALLIAVSGPARADAGADSAAAAAATSSATTSTPAKAWEFEIVPYLFLAGLSGQVGINGIDGQVNMSPGDIMSHLDFGLMGYFEAVHRRRWIFSIDAIYCELGGQMSEEIFGPLGLNSATDDLDLDVTQQVYQPSVGYRFVDDAITMDGFVGARYTSLAPTITLTSTTGGTLPGGVRSTSKEVSWWDPVIGARMRAPLSRPLAFVGSLDFGSFGGGAEFSYQVIAGLDWRFAKAWSAKAGYRVLYQDYRDEFDWDMTMSGFYTGVGFRF